LKSLSPLTKKRKGIEMWKIGWFGVVKGNSSSLNIAPFDRTHINSC